MKWRSKRSNLHQPCNSKQILKIKIPLPPSKSLDELHTHTQVCHNSATVYVLERNSLQKDGIENFKGPLTLVETVFWQTSEGCQLLFLTLQIRAQVNMYTCTVKSSYACMWLQKDSQWGFQLKQLCPVCKCVYAVSYTHLTLPTIYSV